MHVTLGVCFLRRQTPHYLARQSRKMYGIYVYTISQKLKMTQKNSGMQFSDSEHCASFQIPPKKIMDR